MPTPRYARSPVGLFGKCDGARLEIPMAREMRERLARLANFTGKPDATWAREQLEIVILVEEERVKRILDRLAPPVNPRKEG